LTIRENNKNLNVPPAAYVSNNFIRKFITGEPYSIVAGVKRGIISAGNLVGLEYDFDLVLRISYAAYKSYRDPAEAGNGAIGRRTNGYPHQVDLAEYTTSSLSDRKEMLDAALENLYAHANGVKMSQYEAEEVRVHVARGFSHLVTLLVMI
jgi:hypothetical protein